ncbi:MAG: hypothetical protein V3W37_10575 [Candidatus Binatia bacterium]
MIHTPGSFPGRTPSDRRPGGKRSAWREILIILGIMIVVAGGLFFSANQENSAKPEPATELAPEPQKPPPAKPSSTDEIDCPQCLGMGSLKGKRLLKGLSIYEATWELRKALAAYRKIEGEDMPKRKSSQLFMAFVKEQHTILKNQQALDRQQGRTTQVSCVFCGGDGTTSDEELTKRLGVDPSKHLGE